MSNYTLYILDDDEQYADLLADIASNAGWLSIAEQNPVNFLKNDLSKIDILVLDLNMPEMDGIEVIRNLAERHATLSLILVSGFDSRVLHSAQQLAEAHNLTVVASLTKPISIAEFVKVLNSIEDSTPENEKLSARQAIPVKELEYAIKNDQLILYYQPQIKIKTRTLSGVEALVRWNHPQRGMIFPDQFIQLAEDNNLIAALTEKVIEMAVRQNKLWQAEEFNTTISVNVSAENIISLTLPEYLKKLVDEHEVVAGNIKLELTESAVMGKLTSSLDVLNRLRMKGFELSIDDFGTGYSSFSHLYQAPFTELKIDQKFVMSMIEDSEAEVIVKVCIMLGQMMGMELVAEGVETQEIWDRLSELGCDIAQGYLMAKPMPAEDLVAWERARH